jgi:hypothetical protein
MFGGSDASGDSSNDMYILNTKVDAMSWKKPRVTGDLPMPRSLHALAAVESSKKVYMFGGISQVNNATTILDDLTVFDIGARHCTFITACRASV